MREVQSVTLGSPEGCGCTCEADGEYWHQPTCPVPAPDDQQAAQVALDARALRGEVERLRAEVERLHSWDGLMELLDEHWPASIFPTMPDREDRDPGPRIISLIRTLDARKRATPAELTRIRQLKADIWADLT